MAASVGAIHHTLLVVGDLASECLGGAFDVLGRHRDARQLALDLGYLSNDAHQPVAAEIDEVARMLHTLRTKVEQGDP